MPFQVEINGIKHDITHTIYSRSTGVTYDFVHPLTGNSLYGKTLDVIRKEYPDAEILPEAEAYALHTAFQVAKYTRAPFAIPAERWDEMLNILPPMKWHHSEGAETFMVREALAGNIRMIFCKIGKRYWEMAGPQTLTHDEIVKLCLA